MYPYLKTIQQFYTKQQTNTDNVCGTLYHCYADSFTTDSPKAQALFEQLSPILRQLSFHDNNLVFDIICHLCGEYERIAFLSGIHIGFRLSKELALVDTTDPQATR